MAKDYSDFKDKAKFAAYPIVFGFAGAVLSISNSLYYLGAFCLAIALISCTVLYIDYRLRNRRG